jgi:ribose-phosphate pyrophosphokinase
MPYFPYSRQSKKKSHRGAITARMIANLLSISGVDHVITIDLHATQMQGFFKCPVDNLVAEPLIARWIKHNVPDWKDGVVVSKNPGGTKRVTSLADALKVNFGIVTTDRRKPHQQPPVDLSETPYDFEDYTELHNESDGDVEEETLNGDGSVVETHAAEHATGDSTGSPRGPKIRTRTTPPVRRRMRNSGEMPSSPLAKSALPGNSPDDSPSLDALIRVRTEPAAPPSFEDDMAEEFTDEVSTDAFSCK